VPKPVTLIEKGKLKNFLLTRQPVKGFDASNGHARMPGNSGARTPAISNLFVRASEASSTADLKKRLIDLCKQRNKPYGMLVRKMDYPSSGSVEETRRVLSSMGQSASTRPVSMPVLVYRVYPDGREELVRGLRFRGLSVRSLKDILAASSESYAFHFMNNLAPFALMGAGGYVAPASVIAPSILFEDLELEQPQEDMPKLPLVAPPPLTASR
jgi:TldD protein